MPQAKVAIIGGTGFYSIEGMTDVEEIDIDTPFGKPSEMIRLGTFGGVRIAFLPRHGSGHRISPSELPARANIFALKTLGVEYLISVCAVGSLKENIKPLDLVIPDQIIDRTKNRPATFFSGGIVGHISFAQPFCQVLSEVVFRHANRSGARVHNGGTCVVMEGPQFSTRAESELYRSWGADIIVMTMLPEAKLAREAEICYSNIAIVTDYDCWNEKSQSVTVEMIVNNLNKMVATSKVILMEVVTHLPKERNCPCSDALKTAITTSPEMIPLRVKRDLQPIIGKYIK